MTRSNNGRASARPTIFERMAAEAKGRKRSMLMVTRVEDAIAWVRAKGGVYKQVELYHRGDVLLMKHGSGYLRIGPNSFGEYYSTSHADVKVLELDIPPSSGKIVQDQLKLTFKAN